MKAGDFPFFKPSSGLNIAVVDIDTSQQMGRKIQINEAVEILLVQKDLPSFSRRAAF